MYNALHVSYKILSVESCALQANICDNLNKGYRKLGRLKADDSGRERANSCAPPGTLALCNMSHECVLSLKHGLESTVAHRL